MDRHFRALFPALLIALFAGCGGDEPALKDEMSSTDKAKYEKATRQEAAPSNSPTVQMQGGQDYQNSTQGGGRPKR